MANVRRSRSTSRGQPGLSGKVALVTGGGVRVGRAIVIALAGAGATVAVHYNRSRAPAIALVRRLQAARVRAHAFAADLAEDQAPAALFKQVKAWAGRLDILVNSAAGFERRAFATLDPASVRAMMALNFVAPFELSRQAHRELARRRGVIVNILDVAAFSAWSGYAHYCASKAALAMLTRCLAVELAPRVRVAGVAPGTVAFPDDYDATSRRRVLARIPLARIGHPEDIARAVLFLASNDYVTGSVIAVDGGRMAGARGVQDY
jgi:pteridine reductase